MKLTTEVAYNTNKEQLDLPNNAVIVDLGCKDASFLLAFEEAFPNKLKSAIGVDVKDKWFNNVEYKKIESVKIDSFIELLDSAIGGG